MGRIMFRGAREQRLKMRGERCSGDVVRHEPSRRSIALSRAIRDAQHAVADA